MGPALAVNAEDRICLRGILPARSVRPYFPSTDGGRSAGDAWSASREAASI